MNQTGILTFCLIILTLNGIQGIPHLRTVRCRCIDVSRRPVHPKTLEEVEIIPQSLSCPHVEIIATMKNGKKQCLNPESKATKKLLKAFSKERSKRSP
ncbi:C-X-C motif chemokine 10 [Perognathus longimembris pacificus]|uniref:C-X-C motif chemokine 10 n=1 Tax=Perognathus longimembris pacificus TaxID=214514 RepID=UPI0020185085|nr:C-X-C motif chemokine 10 [Perognathus longimembris pacificus]